MQKSYESSSNVMFSSMVVIKRFIMSTIIATVAFTATGCGVDNTQESEAKGQSCLGSCGGDPSTPNASSPRIVSSYDRFLPYNIVLSNSDRAHWDSHRANVGPSRWEEDFRRDVVNRVFARRGCTKTGSDHAHWVQHLINNVNNIPKFLYDVARDCR